MRVGSMAVMITLGVTVCTFFGIAVFMGGWLAYGVAAGCSLALAGIVGLSFSRARGRVKEALDGMAAGACFEGNDDFLDASLSMCSSVMSEKQRQAAFFEGALKELGSPALVCGRDGVILLTTASMLQLIRKEKDAVVGKTVSRALYGREGASLTEKVLNNGKGMEESLDLVLWDGRTVSVRLFINMVHDCDGETAGAVATFIDMTDQVERRQEIEEQRERMANAGERISGLAEHVASATELLSASADDQAQGALKQRNQTSSVSTAMGQMTETVMEVAKNASVTSEAANEAHASATEGVSMVDKAVAAINEVAESAEQLEVEVGELDSQAAEIGKIISVINDIADQTNLLALNAAIEAARAGEAGRGFAVVADEVRKLAEKTMDATREVETAIGTIQERSRNATESMHATARRVSESTDLSNQAGEALQHIMSSIQDMVGRVAEIATAAEEQSSAAEEVMHSVEEIAIIAEDADEAAGQAASATRDMAELARDLLNVSQEFRDGKGDMMLRESEGEMKGILPKLAQGYVQSEFGNEIYTVMQEEMGNPVFLPMDSYPDQVLMQMAEIAARKTNRSVRDFFLGLGRFTVVKLHEMYPGYFKDDSLKAFYMRMNEVHAQLTKDQPGIKPPNFTYEDKGDDLFMNYRSSRGLFDYFEGMLLGAADFKGESVTVAVKPFDEETARAEIVFHGKK